MKLFIFILLLFDVYDGSQIRSLFLETIPERIPEYLRQLCPNANACIVNDSNVVTLDDPIFRSCCSDCSCKLDCAVTGSCCFPPKDQIPNTSEEGETSPIEKEDVDVQCLYPKTSLPRQDDHLMFHSFNIISSLSSDQRKGCFNKMVAPWGSFYPVSSKKTGKIYKNSACANVYNITDGVLWDAIMKCETLSLEEYKNMGIYFIYAALENGEMPKECIVQFVYPGDFNDIKSQVCFKDAINYCTAEEFQVPPYLNATKEDISEACLSGLVSPYYDMYNLYANVFCYICSDGILFSKVDKCRIHMSEKGGIGSTEFMTLLNIDAFENKRNSFSNYKKNMACPNSIQPNTSLCRPVLCPSGQIFGTEGKCVFPMKIWYMQLYTVALELKSEQIIDLQEIFNLSRTEFDIESIDVLYLSNTLLLRSWQVVQMFYENTKLDNDRTTHTLLVYMNRKFNQSEPTYIIRKVASLLNTKWLLRYKNETLVLKPSLFKLKTAVRVDDGVTSDKFLVNSSFSVQYSTFFEFFLLPTPFKNGFRMTKLHFCSQVELGIDEYLLNPNRTVLYNKYSQNYIFDGEFIINNYNSDGSVRICLEDSGFVKTSSACANVYRSFGCHCLYFCLFLHRFIFML